MFSDQARVMLMAVTKLRWPGCKKDVLLFVLANEQHAENGVECSQRIISEWTGISANVVRKYLLELVDEKILERHDGGGPRGHAFRVVREFALWRSRWFGKYPNFDRDWNLAQSAAIAELENLILTLEDRKTGSVAHPDRPLGTTVARRSARLRNDRSPQSRAPERATSRPLAGVQSARQAEDPNDVDTSISNSSSNYLAREPASEAAKRVLGRINACKSSTTWLAPRQRARVIAAVDSVGSEKPFLATLDGMTNIHALDLVDAVEDLAAAAQIPKPAARVPDLDLTQLDAGDAVSAEEAQANVRAIRERLRTRADGAATCETVSGGAT